MTISNIGLVNLSPNLVSPADAMRMASSVSVQLLHDVKPLWGKGAHLHYMPNEGAVPADWMLMVLLDDPDQAGALGYHDETPAGRIYSKVFCKPSFDNGSTAFEGDYPVSTTLSHEACEMLIDPYANFWAQGPDGAAYALELCDAVEDQSYVINGVPVSNFLTPEWFDRALSAPVDHLEKLAGPFQISDGGYVIKATLMQGSASSAYLECGRTMPKWRRKLKCALKTRTMRRICDIVPDGSK